MTNGPQHNSGAKMPAHHDGHHPHPRADGPATSHENHDHQQRSGQPVTTGRITAAPAHQHGVHTDHDKHAGHSVEMFRQKFWGTLLLSVPTIVWAPMIQQWFGYEAPGGTVSLALDPRALRDARLRLRRAGSSSRAPMARSPIAGPA